MEIVLYIGILFLGLSGGSFLNAYVFRLETGESAFRGRSHCMHCGYTLGWMELVPVLSFVALGGKCKACRHSISFQYPLVELLTAGLFLLVFVRYPFLSFPRALFFSFSGDFFFFSFWAGLAVSFFATGLLLAIAMYDFRTRIIALAPLLLLGALSLALRIGEAFRSGVWQDFGFAVVGAFFAFLLFFSIWFFSRGRAMGFGDAELAAVLFLFLGPFHGILALLSAFWSGALFGTALIFSGAATRKSEIPFGPFLVFGAFVAWLWGDAIVLRYMFFFSGG